MANTAATSPKIPWNKNKKTGIIPRSAFKLGHPAPKTAFKKGFTPWNKNTKGLQISPRKGKHFLAITGSKNGNWNEGVSPENMKIRRSVEYRLWRESVYARDAWTCQKCKDNSGGNLNPHHILNFSEWIELRFVIDNGITLCTKCHNKFHKKYGVKKNTRSQLEEFLTEIICPK